MRAAIDFLSKKPKGLKRAFELTVRKILKPMEKITLSEWSERFRVVPAGTSHYSGKWKNEMTPHLVEPMNAVTDPDVHTVVLCGPAQAAKTAFVENAIGYFMHWEPSPIILVMPVDALVESFSKERLAPMIRETKVLSELMNVDARRESGNKIDEKLFPGGSLFIGSGSTVTTYVQRARRIAIGDDLDQLAIAIKNQGDPITLLKKRTETFPNRKLILLSTPTDEQSHIMRHWRLGDRGASRLPCPDCDHRQYIQLEKFHYEQDGGEVVTDSVFYVCQKCGVLIPSSKADWMRARITYEAQRPRKGVASFLIQGGAFDAGWKPWPDLIQEHLDAKENHETLRTYWNVTLNRIWENRREVPPWEILAAREKTFDRGTIPAAALVLTIGCDVQHDRLEVMLCGWGKDRKRFVIQHWTFAGDPANEATWAPLKSMIRQSWPAPLLSTAIDCGDGNTSPHVYRFVREMASDRVIAVKGSSRYMETYIDTARQLDMRLDGKREQSGVKVWLSGGGYIKSEIYSFFRLEYAEPQPPGWIYFASGFPEEFYKQAVSETLAAHRVGGQLRHRWIKIRERNEILDLLVLTTAAAASRGWHTWTTQEWERLENAKKLGLGPEERQRRPQRRESFGGITLD